MSIIDNKKDLIYRYDKFYNKEICSIDGSDDFLAKEEVKRKFYAFFDEFSSLENSDMDFELNNIEDEITFLYKYSGCIITKIEFLNHEEGLEYRNFYPNKGGESSEIIGHIGELIKLKSKIFEIYEKVLEYLNSLPNKSNENYIELFNNGKRMLIEIIVPIVSMRLSSHEDEYIKLLELGISLNSLQSRVELVRYLEIKDIGDPLYLYDSLLNDILHDKYKYDQNYPFGEHKFVLDLIMPFIFAVVANLNRGFYSKAKGITESLLELGFKIKNNNPNAYALFESLKNNIRDMNARIDNVYSETKIVNLNYRALKAYFQESTINLMSNEVKIFVITSINVYEHLTNSDETLDYSAAVMPIMKAVEMILYEIIGQKYLQYLQTIEDLDITQVPDALTEGFKKNKKLKSKCEMFDIGDAIYAIAERIDWNNTKGLFFEITDISDQTEQIGLMIAKKMFVSKRYFADFCTRNGILNAEDIIVKLAYKIDIIRNKRNMVAHRNRVVKSVALECKEFLLITHKLIELTLQTFSFCFE